MRCDSGFSRQTVIDFKGAFACAAAMMFSLEAQAQCRYEVTAIIQGPSCGIFGHANVELKGLNDLGQACGVVHQCAGGELFWPCVWTEESGLVILDLPPEADRGEAIDINNVVGTDGFGQVACTLEGGTLGGKRAYLYDDGVWTNLGVLPGHTSSEAAAINDNAVIVGRSRDIVITGAWRAISWSDRQLAELKLPIGPRTEASDVSERNTVVGWMGESSTSFSSAFLWLVSIVEVLPPLRKADSNSVTAVNNNDVVVGQSGINQESGPDPTIAWIFENGMLTSFDSPDELDRMRAIDMNDAGQIVLHGDAIDPFIPSQAFLWQHGHMVNINTLFDAAPGLSFGTALVAINNRGQIAGRGSFESALVGVILSPVDQPFGDINIDCAVDEHDLVAVLNDWGQCPALGSCLCDIVTSATLLPPGDGVVDGADLAVVLGNWSETGSEAFSERSTR